MPATPPMRFDPFQDRLSRDIRNDLSKALLSAIARQDLSPVRSVADGYLAGKVTPCHVRYIEDRLARHARALEIIADRGIRDHFAQALVLWDLGLFFEVHEILEPAWQKAQGPEKSVLQAMIRAAGFYIKSEYGHRQGAARMAAKAVAALEENRPAIQGGFDLAALLRKLRALDPHPPKLLASPSAAREKRT